MKLIIDVLTLDTASPRRGSIHKQIDWNDSGDRKWLQNHMHWAMNNEHSVSVSPNIYETMRAND